MGLWLGKREGDRDDNRERKLLELSLALQPLSRMFKNDFLRSKNKLNIWGCPGASIITWEPRVGNVGGVGRVGWEKEEKLVFTGWITVSGRQENFVAILSFEY